MNVLVAYLWAPLCQSLSRKILEAQSFEPNKVCLEFTGLGFGPRLKGAHELTRPTWESHDLCCSWCSNKIVKVGKSSVYF